MGKNILIFLSINKGLYEEFEFSLDSKVYLRLKDIYFEEKSRPDFDNAAFWSGLNSRYTEVAEKVKAAIVEELRHYIFEDDFYEIEDVRPDDCFPLADLHFDYLTANGEKTMRHLDCAKCVIYDDNEFDCDLSISFEME